MIYQVVGGAGDRRVFLENDAKPAGDRLDVWQGSGQADKTRVEVLKMPPLFSAAQITT